MMKRKHSEMRENPHSEKGAKKKAGGYLGDPRLLPRIEQYLQSQKNKRVISVVSMADDLQARYSEYGRKKRNFFRKTVEKAYETYCSQLEKDAGNVRDSARNLEKKHLQKHHKNQGMSSSEDSDSEASFSDENPAYVEYKDTNSMNSFMTQMYKSKRPLGLASGTSTPQTQPSSPLRSADEDLKTTATPSQPLRKSRSCPPSPRRPWHSGEEAVMENLPFVIDRVGSGRNASPESNGNLSAGSVKPESKDVGMSPVSKLKREGVIQSPRSKMCPSSPVSRMLSTVAEDAAAESDEVIIIPDDTISGRSTPNTLVQTDAVAGQQKKNVAADTGQPASRPPTPVKEKSTKKVKKKSGLLEREGKKKGPEVQQSTVKFADVGGNEATLKEVCKLLVHMKHPEVYRALGVTPPQGFLLHGPPGCGKTLLAHAIAGELEVAFIKLAATEIVSGVSGESEEKLRDVFDKAIENAPCVLFLDEIDAITPKRETASKDMERRIVSQLLTCMDELVSKANAHVLVIGATNRPDSLDPALRRAGRFDREISLGIPDESARMRILQVLCRGLRLGDGFDFVNLAHLTPGFVGADLMALTREAAITAVNRVFTDLQTEHKSSCLDSGQADASVRHHTDPGIPDDTSPITDPPSEPNTVSSSQLKSDTPHIDSDSCRTLNHDGGGTADQDIDSSQRLIVLEDQHQIEAKPESVPSTCNVTEPSDSRDMLGDVQADLTESTKVLTDTKIPSEHIMMGDSDKEQQDAVPALPVTLESHPAMEVEEDEKVSQEVANPEALSDKQRELNAVLKWLKDQPPLTPEQLASLWIEMADFEVALKTVQPSAKREGFATIPDTTWDDIGALRDVRDELQMAIMAPVQHPEYFKSLGLKSPPGILLAGPPGCGKTLLAKAIANESGINFISVKGPELLNMYVGESERAVRQVFQRARNSAPCVIFFDEIDALCPRRSDSGEGGSSVRVVNQLLTEMDGLEERKQVFIMAATNRPDIIDPAILRPGRLDKTLYVGLPTAADRHDILITITKNGKKPLLSEDVDLQTIAGEQRLNGYTGADLAALVREASVSALREFMTNNPALLKAPCASQPSPAIIVHQRHFELALSKVKPSVSAKDKLLYERMQMTRS